MGILATKKTILIIATLSASALLANPAHSYELGGTCLHYSAEPRLSFKPIDEAVASENWEKAIELHKLSVRYMCSNRHRWYSLVETLLKADKKYEAIRVLEEMSLRKFDINPSSTELHPELANFMNTTGFKYSKVGLEMNEKLHYIESRRKDFKSKLNNLSKEQKPPEHYVSEGVCPFECCQYTEWTVAEETELYDKPIGSTVVSRVSKGEKVKGLTGNVYLRPEPIGVIYDTGYLKDSDIVFRLDYMGEAIYSFWHNGVVNKQGYEFWPRDTDCLKASESCWFIEINKEQPSLSDWWVKVKSSNGIEGWTNKNKNFKGMNGCDAYQ